jgi:hypothetical protein
MTVIDRTKMRSLRNWIADGVITNVQAQSVLKSEDVFRSLNDLVSYNDLGNLKLIDNSLRFDAVWNSGYTGAI